MTGSVKERIVRNADHLIAVTAESLLSDSFVDCDTAVRTLSNSPVFS